MQYLDNNMEELFIKASEGYSVKTPNDWEVIASMIQNDKIIGSKKFSWVKTTQILFSMFILTSLAVELKDTKVIFEKNVVPVNTNTTNLMKYKTEISSNNSISKKVIFEKRNFNQFQDYSKTIFYPLKGSASFSKINKSVANNHFQIGNNSFEINSVIKDNSLVINDNVDKNKLSDIIASNAESIMSNSIISSENITKTSSKEPEKIDNHKSNKQFYIGIQTGISYSQIKSQGFTKPGYNIGFIAGFAINKKWAVETGLLLTNKSYYTSGEYFNNPKSDPFMPLGMVVKSLNGNCNMFEIPLTIKYNFPTKKENRLFFTNVGITNYIITKEHNNYLASVNGGIPQHLEATYNKTNIIGAINLGLGYENKLYKKIKIRFEPYLQIPINGIGIGELPVSTVGLHIGFFNNR